MKYDASEAAGIMLRAHEQLDPKRHTRDKETAARNLISTTLESISQLPFFTITNSDPREGRWVVTAGDRHACVLLHGFEISVGGKDGSRARPLGLRYEASSQLFVGNDALTEDEAKSGPAALARAISDALRAG